MLWDHLYYIMLYVVSLFCLFVVSFRCAWLLLFVFVKYILFFTSPCLSPPSHPPPPPFFCFCFLVFCFFVFVLLFFHLCLPAPFAMVQRLHRQIIIINNVVIMY
ncbi:T. brucei spp.-specific protein [Trypanosoma brucei gambiense DAL972]|uniref:T. brucei spp.-specific protein n=1 Tax=Trypanosoma brucei gambiense (strain MHOM/CI/86/DAL972) TaxID=679716 RepID=C9ZIF9_TRYB9|nr:T. brucei spp.-specific protein [Trypanosoma brucei gambiense DAL972]CBH08951.1 T. brucei spp.-specific protein [Trypanosoma brucei gambiense DAL972]|eukprot:XP_011771392.1 T. brucei spp.-specific protein [Trypanosoma brucei gambiense DAL972]